MRRDHRFQRVPRTPKHRVESLSNATMEDRWEEETFSQLDVCKLFALSTNPPFLYPCLINNAQLRFCSPCESIRAIRATLYENFVGCRCVFPLFGRSFLHGRFIFVVGTAKRWGYVRGTSSSATAKASVFRKNVSRNTFRFNYFALYPSFLAGTQVYVFFVWRCSRSDRRAPKHVLRAYEARPIQSMHYLSLQQ